jgi:hypothetical protein
MRDLAFVQRGANLAQQLAKARGIAGRAAKAGLAVKLCEFLDGGGELP